MVDYLSSQYGIVTKQLSTTLTQRELDVQIHIEKIIQILDSHMIYWSRIQPTVTPKNLILVRTRLLNLLNSIRYVIDSTC